MIKGGKMLGVAFVKLAGFLYFFANMVRMRSQTQVCFENGEQLIINLMVFI